MSGGQKVLSPNILDHNFFHNLYISETWILQWLLLSLVWIWRHCNLWRHRALNRHYSKLSKMVQFLACFQCFTRSMFSSSAESLLLGMRQTSYSHSTTCRYWPLRGYL